MKWGVLILSILILSIFFSSLQGVQGQIEEDSGVSLTPNSMSGLEVSYDQGNYVFQLKNFYMKIRPFIIYQGEHYGIKSIVSFIRNNFPNVDYKWLVDKSINAVHYGFNLTNLPPVVSSKMDFLGFRLTDYNFPLSWFKLVERPFGDNQTVTLVTIPRANLIFSFHDLYPYGYSIQHINSTYILVGNVKDRSNLIFDPVTLSGDIINISGYTEESSCDFTEVYNADLSGSYLLADDLTQGQDQSLTTQIRPSDSGALQLTIDVSTYNTPKGDIRLNGTDFFDNQIDESIEITATGVYVSVNNYKTIYAGGIDIDPDVTLDILQPRWGVLSLIECQVFLETIMIFNTGSYFKETCKQIVFLPYWDISGQIIFQINAGASVIFGEYDPVNKISSEVVHWIDIGGVVTFSTYFIDGFGNLTWNGGTIMRNGSLSSNNLRYNGYETGNYWIRNVLFRGNYFNQILDTANFWELISVTNIDSAYGWSLGGVQTVEGIESHNISTRGAFELNPDANQSVRDLKTVNCYDAIYRGARTGYDNHYIDCDFHEWTIDVSHNGRTFRDYTFNLNVTYPSGTPIESANVTISYSGNGGGDMGSWLTYGNGSIPTQILSHGFYNWTGGNTIYDYNPYLIEITGVSGYTDYSGNFTHEQINYLIISMTPSEFPLGLGAGFILSLALCLVLGLAYLRKQ